MINRFLITLLTLGLASAASADSLPHPESADYTIGEYDHFRVEVPGPQYRDFNLFSQVVDDGLITITYAHTLPNRFSFPEHPPVATLTTINGLPAGNYTLKVVRLEAGSTHIAKEFEKTIKVEVGPEPIPVYGMFHTEIEHFFITADTEERDFITQHGWNVIDKGFSAWPSEGDAPESALPVCRFYSEKVNSHFYTLDEEECEFLKDEQHGWIYEGIAFKAIPPISGVCAEGTEPVWRMFNPGTGHRQWEGQWITTVNHRFTTDQNVYQMSVVGEFQAEGVAFCSPR